MAIGIKLTKVIKEHDLGASKFFGTPTFPIGLEEKLSSNVVFVGQIRLQDIIPFDEENNLPHEGYLYFFIETEDESPYSKKRGLVIHSVEEVKIAITDFNSVSPIPNGLNDDYIIEFFKADDSYDGIKLLGYPSDWNYQNDSPALLLQFDPLDTEELDFFSLMDGYIYFFFGKDKNNFNEITLHFEYS